MRPQRLSVVAAALLAVLLAAPSVADGPGHPEAQLADALAAMRDGDYGGATRRLEALLHLEPNFQLAHLLYGQVLALRSGPRIGTPLTDEGDGRIEALLAEYRQRHDGLRALPPAGQVPSLLLQLADDVRNALVVDLGRGRAYLIDNGPDGPHVVRNLYAGIGRSGFGKRMAGDLRTPIGVYRITGWMADSQLPPLYGAGALPLNYPNSWDRAQGRTGSGIWLHGVPQQTYARAPRSSEGCVTFANSDLLALRELLAIGSTPVILAESLDWVAANRLDDDRAQLLQAIEGWRRHASAVDPFETLSDYAGDFRSSDGLSKAAFSDQQQRLNADRQPSELRLGDISLIAYPGEPDLVLAQFLQNRDDGGESRRDQYWRRQADGRWKIVRELDR